MMSEHVDQIIEAEKILPALVGHQKKIWDALSFPRTLGALYKEFSHEDNFIPQGSIRRVLYELSSSGYVQKKPKEEKKGVKSKAKWERKIGVALQT